MTCLLCSGSRYVAFIEGALREVCCADFERLHAIIVVASEYAWYEPEHVGESVCRGTK